MDTKQAVEFLKKQDTTDTNTISRAKSSLKISVLSVSDEMAETSGSEGEIYHTTLGTCSCVDWTRRKNKEIPCKHQLALANHIISISDDEEAKAIASDVMGNMINTNKPKKTKITLSLDEWTKNLLTEEMKKRGSESLSAYIEIIISQYLLQVGLEKENETIREYNDPDEKNLIWCRYDLSPSNKEKLAAIAEQSGLSETDLATMIIRDFLAAYS